jgi:hypothetical protein
MARTAQIQENVQYGGRFRTEGAEAFGTTCANLILGALALVGKPATAAAAGLRRGLATWAEARKQRAEDEKLWTLALQDARIMADLSRAMSQEAVRGARYY